MRKTAIAGLALILTLWQMPADAKAPATRPTRAVQAREPVEQGFVAPIPWQALYRAALMAEFVGVRIPTFRYMADVAQCETGRDPGHIGNTREGHTYRGAFGFYTQEGGRGGTWDQWGGWEFARYADQADYLQQIVIFLRVHITGFYDYRPDKLKWWPPAGLSVNNCSRYAAPLEWFTYP